jgi:hypothetical protein
MSQSLWSTETSLRNITKKERMITELWLCTRGTKIYKAARRNHVLPVNSGMNIRYKIDDFFSVCVSVETTTFPSMEI